MTLLRRSFTSVVLIAAIVYILFWQNALLFSLAVTLTILAATAEFFNLLKRNPQGINSSFGIFMSLIIPTVVYFWHGHSQSGEVLFLVLGCLFLFVLKFLRGEKDSLVGICLTLFGILYISWFMSFLIKIRLMPQGVLWVAYLLSVTKAADIGAYLVGRSIGKHALIKTISPNKTIEGTWGGFLFSAAVSLTWKDFLPYDFSALHLLVMGFFLGVIGMIGDLSESLLKRFCDSKDSGSVLPGMGGFLDAIDSVLFTAPIFYYYLKIFI